MLHWGRQFTFDVRRCGFLGERVSVERLEILLDACELDVVVFGQVCEVDVHFFEFGVEESEDFVRTSVLRLHFVEVEVDVSLVLLVDLVELFELSVHLFVFSFILHVGVRHDFGQLSLLVLGVPQVESLHIVASDVPGVRLAVVDVPRIQQVVVVRLELDEDEQCLADVLLAEDLVEPDELVGLSQTTLSDVSFGAFFLHVFVCEDMLWSVVVEQLEDVVFAPFTQRVVVFDVDVPEPVGVVLAMSFAEYRGEVLDLLPESEVVSPAHEVFDELVLCEDDVLCVSRCSPPLYL